MSALAHWCVRHRRIVFGGWFLVVAGLVAAVVLGGSAFTSSTTMPDSESSKAYALLAKMSTGESTTTGKIAWRGAAPTEITTLLDQVRAVPGVVEVKNGSTSGDTSYASVVLKSDADVAPVEKLVTDASFDVTYGGTAFDTSPEPSHGTEVIGLIVALILLMLMFRSWWASFLPLITGVAGVGVSLLLVMVGSHVVTLDSTSITMASMMGLAVGIDYALFIVNRTRKGMIEGRSVPDAIARAVDTSGRAVIFAGLTVIVALLGIRLVGMGVLTGMGEAAAVTVACTVLAALTLLPALMGALGVKILSKKQRAGLGVGTHQASRGPASVWARLVGGAPWLMAPIALAAVLVMASPVLHIRVGDSDASSDPVASAAHKYYAMTAPAFGEGFDNPLVIVADNPVASQFSALATTLKTVPDVASVTRTGPVITVIPKSSTQAQATSDLIEHLRKDVIPASGVRAYIGGKAATNQDLSDALLGRLPLYLGVIAILGFLLLVVAFRSVLVPLVGALSNITSILVGLGVITAIFQYGHGSDLLRVGSGAPINYIVPVMIVGIVFGLSMDYQVFLVSRIHEEWTTTRNNKLAVRVGITETGRVIATAALIMLGVFMSFAFGGERIVSAIGIGLAVAVVADAFLVRMTLIPALMTMLGRANWWYPRWASRVTPHLAVEGSPEEKPSPVPVS